MFDHTQEIKISRWTLLLVAILAVVIATQYWGYYPHSLPGLRELTTVGLMIGDGEFNHPLQAYFRMLPAMTVLDSSLLLSAQFNFWSGILTKLGQLTLSFLILKQITKNQVVILLIIVFFTSGLYVELHPFQFVIKHPTYYGFRYVASTVVLGAVLMVFRGKLVWASTLLGIAFFVHPKVGPISLMLLSATVLLHQYSINRSLRQLAGSAVRLAAPALLLILIAIQFSYWGNYSQEALQDFPTYLMALKIDPDDYFFFDNYANLTPEIFKLYSPAKFVLLIAVLSLSSFFVFWKIERANMEVSDVELMLVAILYCLLLFFSRMSPEVLVFLGLINSACYVRYVSNSEEHERGNVLLGNPVGIIFLVVTAMFAIGTLVEYFIGFLPNWLGPLIYAFKIWKAPHFNTLVGTLIFGIIALRVLDVTIRKSIKWGWEKLNLDILVVSSMVILVVATGLVHDSRSSGAIFGFEIYRTVFGTQQSAPGRIDSLDFLDRELVYEEKRIYRSIATDIFTNYVGKLRNINQKILNGSIVDAEKEFVSLEDTDSPFLSLEKKNVHANLLAAEGKLHQAYQIYLSASKNTIVVNNEYPIFLGGDTYENRYPARIPGRAYSEVLGWVSENTPADALFLNAPHIDGFTEYTGRNAFFPKNKFEVESTPLNGTWAKAYLDRQALVLGMTLFDLPGIVHGNLSRPMIRYAFLAVDDNRMKEILRSIPKHDYIFTERQHKLDYKVVFTNDYFIVYQTGS